MALRRLAVEVDLDLTIDGRSATVRGSGDRVVLTLERAAMLRDLFRVELPNLGDVGEGVSGMTDAPSALAAVGLTVEVRDGSGPLLLLGAEAPAAGVGLPLLGRVRHVKIAGASAALRLALNG